MALKSHSWRKVLHLLLRQGVQPFDEADGSCARMISLLESKVSLLESVSRRPLPGALHNIPNLRPALAFQVQLEAQQLLLRISEFVNEDMYICWKTMSGLVEQGDVDAGWSESRAMELANSVVRVYGHQYCSRKEMVEEVDLTRDDALKQVEALAEKWEQLSFFDPQLCA